MLYYSYRILIIFNVVLVLASWTSVEICATKMPDINRKYICIYLAAFLLLSPSSVSSPRLYIFVLAFTFPPTFISLHSPEFWLVFTLALSLGAALGFQLICGGENCSIIVMDCTCLIDFPHNYRMAGASVNIPAGGLEDLVMFTAAKLSHKPSTPARAPVWHFFFS